MLASSLTLVASPSTLRTHTKQAAQLLYAKGRNCTCKKKKMKNTKEQHFSIRLGSDTVSECYLLERQQLASLNGVS